MAELKSPRIWWAGLWGLLIGSSFSYGEAHPALYLVISVIFGLMTGIYLTKQYCDNPDRKIVEKAWNERHRKTSFRARILLWLFRPPHCPTTLSFVMTVAISCALSWIGLKYGAISLTCFPLSFLGYYVGSSYVLQRSRLA